MSISLMRARLTPDDIRRLVKSESEHERAGVAEKLCSRIDHAELPPEDQEAAREVLRIMANDAAAIVRRAMATTLQNSPRLPHDLAMQLADDVDLVATPILENSPVLTDEDLLAIVQVGKESKQLAIAGRAKVSTNVTNALVEQAPAKVVSRLAANDGAIFSEDSYSRTLERFGSTPEVTDGLITRGVLPPTVAEKLVSLISDEALARLARRHALPPQLAVELAESARERATIDIVDQAGCAADMRRFVEQLSLNGRLTPSLLVRGLCLGHMRFFEHAIGELAGVPHERAWLLVHDAGRIGLKAIYDRAGLPNRLFAVVRSAVDTYHELALDGGPDDATRFAQLMLERLLTREHQMSRDELDYFLDKLDALGADLDRRETREEQRQVSYV